MAVPRKRLAAIIAVIVVLTVVISVLMLPATQGWLRDMLNGQTDPGQNGTTKSLHLVYSKELTINTNGGTIINATTNLPLAVNVASNGLTMQQVISVTRTPQPTAIYDRNGSAFMRWDIGKMEGGSQTITVRYEVTQSQAEWNVDASTSGSIAQIPTSLKARYLNDEWKISFTSAEVTQLSQQLTAGKTDVFSKLKAIYDWMVDNVSYSALGTGDPKSALETLQSKVGDCDDQSILFCSLARAAGVPAWLQLGSLFNSDSNTLGGHGWVQAYIPLATGGGYNVTIDVVNRDFLKWTPIHVLDYTDTGSADDLRDYYHHIFLVYYDPSTYSGGNAPSMSSTVNVIAPRDPGLIKRNKNG